VSAGAVLLPWFGVANSDLRAWIAQFGASVNYLLAAEMTFARVIDEATASPTGDTSALVATAGRRLLAAADIVDQADPVPDPYAAELLGAILDEVRDLVRATEDDNVAQLTVAYHMGSLDAALADLLQRFLDLRH
jgi:hypothetical protein